MRTSTMSSPTLDSAAAIESLEHTFTDWSDLYLPALASAAARTMSALPGGKASIREGNGYRDFMVDAHGKRSWIFPRSHAGERITVFRWLAEELQDPAFTQLAVDYANGMVDDPDRGIYQGPEEDGRGMVWYWRDCGMYMTNYTMRLPRPLLELSAHRDDKYAAAARLCGDQLVRSQRPTGILRDGWAPRSAKPGLECPEPLRRSFLRDTIINSRVGHVASAYACMFRHTGESRYHDALEKLLNGLRQYQNADGSFPTDIRSDRIEVTDPARKGHFMYYILNGFAEAMLDLPQHRELRRMAVLLADYIVERFKICGSCLYGDAIDVSGSSIEPDAWPMASADPAHGLSILAKLTGDIRYRVVALRLVIQALGGVMLDNDPETYGLYPVYLSRPDKVIPNRRTLVLGGHFHFNLLMGIRSLKQWPMS
jgi:hypothetical protein